MNKMRSALKLSRTTIRILGSSDDSVLGVVQGGAGGPIGGTGTIGTIGTIGTVVDPSTGPNCSVGAPCNSQGNSNCVLGCGTCSTVRTQLSIGCQIGHR